MLACRGRQRSAGRRSRSSRRVRTPRCSSRAGGSSGACPRPAVTLNRCWRLVLDATSAASRARSARPATPRSVRDQRNVSLGRNARRPRVLPPSTRRAGHRGYRAPPDGPTAAAVVSALPLARLRRCEPARGRTAHIFYARAQSVTGIHGAATLRAAAARRTAILLSVCYSACPGPLRSAVVRERTGPVITTTSST